MMVVLKVWDVCQIVPCRSIGYATPTSDFMIMPVFVLDSPTFAPRNGRTPAEIRGNRRRRLVVAYAKVLVCLSFLD